MAPERRPSSGPRKFGNKGDRKPFHGNKNGPDRHVGDRNKPHQAGRDRPSFGSPRPSKEAQPSPIDEKKAKQIKAHNESAQKFLQAARPSNSSSVKPKLSREESRKKIRAMRIDPRVEFITVGQNQTWTTSLEERNSCKLSAKFFTGGAVKKLKLSMDTRTGSKQQRYRTEINFDDITHFKIASGLGEMVVTSRIPTLFEVGTPQTDDDGNIIIFWAEARGLDWQQASKNPHPNQYTIRFQEDSFRAEHLDILMKSDERLKKLIIKENPELDQATRGAKRSRDEVAPAPSKAETMDDETTDKSDSKPEKKKFKVSETASKPAAKESKSDKSKSKATSSSVMDVDDKETHADKAASKKEEKTSKENRKQDKSVATKESATEAKTGKQRTDSKSDLKTKSEASSESPAPKKKENKEEGKSEAKSEKKHAEKSKSDDKPKKEHKDTPKEAKKHDSKSPKKEKK